MNSSEKLLMARAALRNATALHADARLLREHGSFGRALALSIIAIEECGKASMLVHRASSSTGGSEERLAKDLGSHTKKQFSATPPRIGFQRMLERIGVDRIRDLFFELSPELTKDPANVDVRLVRTTVEKRLEELTAPFVAELEEIGREIRASIGRSKARVFDEAELQRLKHSGLYVDWDPARGQATQPSDVTKDACDRGMAELELVLEELTGYLDLLDEDCVRLLRRFSDLDRPSPETEV